MLPSKLYSAATVAVATANGSGGDAFTQKILYLSFVICTLVNVYVDLVVFTRIAGTSWTGSGRYWC